MEAGCFARLAADLQPPRPQIGVRHMADPSGPAGSLAPLDMMYAGPSDAEPKGVLEAVIAAVGFRGVCMGSIRYSRNLEAIAELVSGSWKWACDVPMRRAHNCQNEGAGVRLSTVAWVEGLNALLVARPLSLLALGTPCSGSTRATSRLAQRWAGATTGALASSRSDQAAIGCERPGCPRRLARSIHGWWGSAGVGNRQQLY